MFRDFTFKTALAVSFSLHFLAISSMDSYLFSNRGRSDINREIEVTYVTRELVPEKVIEELPKRYNLDQRPTQLKKVHPAKRREAISEEPLANEAYIEEDLEEREVKKTEEYISYYKLLREKIKKYVTRFYRTPETEGVVHVAFRLDSEGELGNISVNDVRSTKSPLLKRIAVKSVRAASPFPPFPKALNKKSLTFSVAIIFKKE